MAQDAVVLLSGGLDSATVLAEAVRRGFRCHALSFRYGQRHAVELSAAEAVAAALGAVEHRVIDIALSSFGGSALTDDIEVPKHDDVAELEGGGVPVTYVPARNTVFLSLGLAWAEVLGADDLFIGVNAVDYSGYPDCRPRVRVGLRGTGQPGHGRGHRGRQALSCARSVDGVGQGRDRGSGYGAGSGLLHHGELLRPGCLGPGVRTL